MRKPIKGIEMVEMLTENKVNIGYCIGITENVNSAKNWSLAIYIGNGYFLHLYDRNNGVNESVFDDILSIDQINKETLKKKNWQPKDVKYFNTFLDNDFDFALYEYNIIEISIEHKLDIKNIISTLKSNLSEIHKLKEGDVVVFDRGLYSHHAILYDTSYMTVVHKWGEPENYASLGITSKSIIGIPTEKACVSEDFVIEVAAYRSLSKGNHHYDSKHKPREKEEILNECKKRLGESGYSILNNNCQNFVSLARNGTSRSPEVETVQSGLLKGAAISSIVAVSALWLFGGRKETNEEKDIDLNKN